MLIACPRIDQRREPGNDGRPPENGNMDCVPAALASMARGLNPALTGRITGDGLHDVVYGEGYVGLMDPARFVGVLAEQFGMRLVGPIVGSAQALYGRACAEIAAGHPVLMSIPSDWNDEPPTSGYAHMVAGCDVQNNGSTATAMNSWLDDYQTETAAWWIERFDRCAYKALWVMERTGVASVGIPAGWSDDGVTLRAPNGVVVVRGFRDWIRTHDWRADDVPQAPEYSVAQVEEYNAGHGGGSRQDFRYSVLGWNGHDNVWQVWTGNEVVTLRGLLSAAGAQRDQAQQELAAARQQIAGLEAEIAQLKAGGAGSPGASLSLSKAAVDALRVALAADAG